MVKTTTGYVMNIKKQPLANILLLLVLLLFPWFASCQPHPGRTSLWIDPDWKYFDLRVMDPIDVNESTLDLIAVYVRRINYDFQIRLDLLDLPADEDYFVLLALDTKSGGLKQLPLGYPTDLAWDILIGIPSSGDVFAIDDQGNQVPGLKIRVRQDPIQDFITTSMSSSNLHQSSISVKFQVFILSGSDKKLNDRSVTVSENGFPPGQVNLLFSFWDTFNSLSPATALRSWDGAHSGMYRDRHGLRYLIDSSINNQIPVALLGLRTPENLSALDYLGGIPLLKKGVFSGFISLPEVMTINIPGSDPDILAQPFKWVYDQAFQTTRQINKSFMLPSSNILVSQLNAIPEKPVYDIIVIPPSDSRSGCFDYNFLKYYSTRLLLINKITEPSCDYENPEATLNGPSIDFRRRLIDTFFDGRKFLLVGGDFLQGNWGNPSAVHQTMVYIGSHPWIHPLSMQDLLFEETQPIPVSYVENQDQPSSPEIDKSSLISVQKIQNELMTEWYKMPPGPLKDQLWSSYQMIFSQPSVNQQNLALNYLGQFGIFPAAEIWKEKQVSQSLCTLDLDWDGKNECILSNDEYFLVVDPDGGVISLALAQQAGTIHQLIGPTYQLAIGLSDPMEWDTTRGIASDPGQILGALQIKGEPGEVFQVSVSKESILLRNGKLGITETISLEDEAINVHIESLSPKVLQIPVLVDPWIRFTPDWYINYKRMSEEDGKLTWGRSDKVGITIETNGELSFTSFDQTHQADLLPEDPNYDYGVGHFLPFPLATAEITVLNQGYLKIRFIDVP